ncbi:MAG: TonB-dependent receptor [Gammaproteobacteria bacterium]|nr:TonB-dependent receptor [Gammaproteobacteria bacterium]
MSKCFAARGVATVLLIARMAVPASAFTVSLAHAQDVATPVTMLAPVVVTAVPFEDRSEFDMAQPVSVLKGDDLRRKREASLGDTLSRELGVTSSTFGPAAGRPIIRGLDGPRIRVLEGGIGTLDISALSPDHMVTVESLNVRQIEILRGPASLLYGGGASGGVVNVVTGRIPERIFTSPQGNFELRTNSASQERTGAFNANGSVNRRFSWHVDAFKRRSEDYDIPGRANRNDPNSPKGVLPNSAIDSGGGALGGSYVGERGFLGAAVSRLESLYGVPVGEGAKIDLGQTRTDIAGDLDDPFAGFRKAKIRLGHNDYRHSEVEPSGEIGTVFRNKGLEGRLELLHALFGGWQGALGVQTQERTFSALGPEAVVPTTKTRANGVFLIEERNWDRWRLEFGGRMDRELHQPQAGLPDRAFNLYNFSASPVWKFMDGYSLGVSATYAQRAPAPEELYSKGVHVATGTFQIGNSALSRETSNNVDLALRKTDGPFTGKINVYANRIRDFIYQKSVDTDGDGVADRADDAGAFDPNGAFLVQYAAQTAARFRGVEAEVMYALIPERLTMRLFADQTRATLSDGAYVPRIPPRRVGLELGYKEGPWQTWLSVLRASRQERVAPLETSAPAYTLVDAELSYRIRQGKTTGYTLFLRGKNLLDDEIRAQTSYLKDFAPLPGRAFAVGVRGEL